MKVYKLKVKDPTLRSRYSIVITRQHITVLLLILYLMKGLKSVKATH